MGEFLRRAPIWAWYLLMVGVLLTATFFVPRDAAFAVGQEVKDPAASILEMLKEITKLAVALNSAILGAAGALTLKAPDWAKRWSRVDSALIVLVFACGSISYFGVYLSEVRLLTMLNLGSVNPLETGLLWSLRLQYYGIISAILLLGLVLCRMLDLRTAPSPQDKAPGRRAERSKPG